MAYYNTKEIVPWRVDKIPAFCINLERRPDRWLAFSKQPAVLDLPNLKRFIGVDGKNLDIMKDDRIPLATKRNIKMKTRRAHEELNTAGGIGCALSHIAVWEWIVENKAPITLVFEDDAKIPQDFVPYLNRCIEDSPVLKDPSTWELMIFTGQRSATKAHTVDPNVVTFDAFIGLQCYVITQACAQRFLKEAYSLQLHIDLWMAVYKSVHGLTIIGLPNYYVHQRGSKTDIQDSNGCKLCDINPNFYKHQILIYKEEFWLLRSMEIAFAAGFLYMLYTYMTSKKR
jgi:GR25 family glycosyltransferase involved in LPS biosynthesis